LTKYRRYYKNSFGVFTDHSVVVSRISVVLLRYALKTSVPHRMYSGTNCTGMLVSSAVRTIY